MPFLSEKTLIARIAVVHNEEKIADFFTLFYGNTFGSIEIPNYDDSRVVGDKVSNDDNISIAISH